MNQPLPERNAPLWILSLMLLVSGNCALMFQVVWIRELRLVFGATTASSAAVLATLDEFEGTDVMDNTQKLSQLYIDGLNALKETGIIAKVRGEGMVFGIECAELGGKTSQEVAIELVKTCYLGESDGDGIHLLGALAGNVLRISPPMTMTEAEAEASIALLNRLCVKLAEQLQGATASA